MNKFKGILALLAIIISTVSFGKDKIKVKTIWVNHTTENCLQNNISCLEIQEGDELTNNWTNYYNNIEGFKYEEGFIYKLKIDEVKIPRKERSKGGAKTTFKLIEIIEKRYNIKEEGLYVQIETTKGDIYGKLNYKLAPLTVANFVGLAEGTLGNTAKDSLIPYYDSLIFHRVIPNFMIQGGDPTGTGSGGPGYKFRNEINSKLSHDKPGVFSMANSGPNTNGSQFFITHKATPWLDGGYNVFGHVIRGQEIVTAIGNTPRNRRDRPNKPIYIKKMKILRVGAEAQSFNANDTFIKLK